tara:strand:+ start:61 stop:492 length:432 start_codon:yes stop_codon:yes gene_type:complete
MKYWIIVASKDHVDTGIAGGFAQACHGKANPLKRMSNGDMIIYYSSKKEFGKNDPYQKFTAIGQISDDEVYEYLTGDNFCPSRIKVNYYHSIDLTIHDIKDQLQFISDKNRWGYPFRWGILEINQHDFELISIMMKAKTNMDV